MLTTVPVVADDHPLVLEGLAAVLATMPEMTLAATARTGREAIEAARANDAELVVMDLGMPELDGLDATRVSLSERPETRVIVLTVAREVLDLEAIRGVAVPLLIHKKQLKPNCRRPPALPER